MSPEDVTIDYTPLPIPIIPKETTKPSSTLTDAQKTLYTDTLSHFQASDYKLPGVENGELLDEERFWLVRPNT